MSTTKQISDPGPLPGGQENIAQELAEMKRWIEAKLRDIHHELDNLHRVKADAA
jgi:hypothetical protein